MSRLPRKVSGGARTSSRDAARAVLAALAAIAGLLAPAARAAPADEPLRVRALAATCAHCHGTDGRPVAGTLVPPLAGLSEAWIVERLAALKAGTAPSTVMGQLAKGYSDAQIRQLAAYFAAVPR